MRIEGIASDTERERETEREITDLFGRPFDRRLKMIGDEGIGYDSSFRCCFVVESVIISMDRH